MKIQRFIMLFGEQVGNGLREVKKKRNCSWNNSVQREKKHQKGFWMQVKGRRRARDREKKITVEHLNQHVRALWMLQKYYFIIPAAAISIAFNVFYLMKLFAEHYSEYSRKMLVEKNVVKTI